MIDRLSVHDVSASYASFGIVRITVAARAAQPSAATGAPTGDNVTLSPEAQAAGDSTAPTEGTPPSGDAAGGPAPADGRPAAPASRAERLAAALLSALDADQNGAISKEEFVGGASALLRGARRVRRGDQGDGDEPSGQAERSHGRHGHGGHRLERRLGRAFDRIDGDGDGQLTGAELVEVLNRLRPRPAGASSPEAGAAAPGGGIAEPGETPASPGSVAPPTEPPQAATADGPGAVPGGAPSPAPSPQAPASPAPAGSPAQAVPGPAAAGGTLFSFSVTTVTFVSVAVQQYRAVDALHG